MSAAMSRAGAPETSAQAALRLELSGRREKNEARVMDAVSARPGRTCGELGADTGLDRVGVAPRLTALFQSGRITQGDRRRCTVQGTNQVTWWPTAMTAEPRPFPGFDAPPPEVPMSAGARLTARNNAQIGRGRHPFGAPLAENGRTCGDCWFALETGNSGRHYWKCERGRLSHSSATDLRLSWPACSLFSASKPEGWETTVPAYVPRASGHGGRV